MENETATGPFPVSENFIQDSPYKTDGSPEYWQN